MGGCENLRPSSLSFLLHWLEPAGAGCHGSTYNLSKTWFPAVTRVRSFLRFFLRSSWHGSLVGSATTVLAGNAMTGRAAT
jgi:hypothetical protein